LFGDKYKQQLVIARAMPRMKFMLRFPGTSLFAATLLCIAFSANAAEGAPPEAIAAFQRGQAYLESGQLEKAISEMERAVTVFPDFGNAWYHLYDSYMRADRLEDAIAALQQLVRIHPSEEFWQKLLALHLADLGIPPGAFEALNRCRRLEPGSKQAINACKMALSLYPDYVDARYFLGVNYIYAGDEKSAKEQLDVLIMLDPTMAGMLANSMDVLTDWLTEEYKRELQHMFDAANAAGEETER
jgi:tetratricopeptide (TPR) repeat protein